MTWTKSADESNIGKQAIYYGRTRCKITITGVSDCGYYYFGVEDGIAGPQKFPAFLVGMICKQCKVNDKALRMIKQKCEDLTRQILDETQQPSTRARIARQAVIYVEWLASNIEIPTDTT